MIGPGLPALSRGDSSPITVLCWKSEWSNMTCLILSFFVAYMSTMRENTSYLEKFEINAYSKFSLQDQRRPVLSCWYAGLLMSGSCFRDPVLAGSYNLDLFSIFKPCGRK